MSFLSSKLRAVCWTDDDDSPSWETERKHFFLNGICCLHIQHSNELFCSPPPPNMAGSAQANEACLLVTTTMGECETKWKVCSRKWSNRQSIWLCQWLRMEERAPTWHKTLARNKTCLTSGSCTHALPSGQRMLKKQRQNSWTPWFLSYKKKDSYLWQTFLLLSPFWRTLRRVTMTRR